LAEVGQLKIGILNVWYCLKSQYYNKCQNVKVST